MSWLLCSWLSIICFVSLAGLIFWFCIVIIILLRSYADTFPSPPLIRLCGTRRLNSDSCCRNHSQILTDFHRFNFELIHFTNDWKACPALKHHSWRKNYCLQEPVRSLFCDTDSEVSEAFSDLIASSKKTLDSILELQQVYLWWKNLSLFRFTLKPSQRHSNCLLIFKVALAPLNAFFCT